MAKNLQAVVKEEVKEEVIEENEQVRSNINKMKDKSTAPSINNKRKLGTPRSSGEAKHLGQVKSPSVVEAERIQLSLGTEFPCFIKCLSRSNIEGFFCNLSLSFCTLHLPKNRTTITLEDENEVKFEVEYIPAWMGMSSGWWDFAVAHKLRERDVLLFHLVEPTNFKVYIIRAHGEVNVNPSLLIPDSSSVKSEQGGPESSDPTDTSQDLGTFEAFKFKIRSLCVESALDEDTLKKYYKLCCCKNDILHDKIFCYHNSKLVAGIISETVDIADAVKACNVFTPREKLEQWENSLKSFKLLGMKVEFLVNRVSEVLKVGVGFEGSGFEDEIKNLEAKRVELKEAYKKVGVDIEKMKSEAERRKIKFQQVIDSPW